MAKLLGPDFMSLQVRDLAISRAFYAVRIIVSNSALVICPFICCLL
jgi:hypothetical protein